MSEQISEQLSALLDGELPEAELSLLLRQIEKQPEMLLQAQCVQQARVCVQGEQPISSISDTIRLSASIQSAIRDEPAYPSYDLTNKQRLSQQLISGLENQADTLPTAGLTPSHSSPTQKNNLKSSALTTSPGNDRWKPLIGTGIAAAVALFAVSTWQLQTSQPDLLNTPFAVQNNPDLISDSAHQSLLSSGQQTNQGNVTAGEIEAQSLPKTVPNISELSFAEPFNPNNGSRQVKYSDFLLQNQVAPNSTATQLTQLADELRATQSQQVFYDPRTGRIVMTIRPIDRP
ncbi:MAG: hypothetical protein HKN88_00585 [Gammaproteobacteria bacterium]|nr:hypothetical protein [Gammaproteobacteria bacterium]NNC96547.1 hypothetical protein [Gammaproteobacteria bacterium]NNM12906.1 hypothetical protein [Gammaproteobacteria bacterium]